MRSKFLLIIAAALALGSFLAAFVRSQPTGCASVFRRANSVAVRTQSVYLRPLSGGDRCCTKVIAGRLAFDASVVATSATADEIPLRVRFTYDAPSTLPADWPGGDWCGSLAARVTAIASNASRLETADGLLTDRRAAGDRIAAAIERELQRASVRADAVSVRVDLPPGFERLRVLPELARQAHSARPVIFVGLDGADWQLLDEYIANGSMPNLERLVTTGAGGVLETDYPPLSPLVWTTMMTGVSPLDHAILDFTRFNPYTHDKEPITSDERRAPAVWNMLTYAGRQTAVFGLWATYAAEAVHGLNVSDRLFTFLYSDVQKPAGVVWPASRQAWSERTLSDAEGSIDAARMREYLPSLTDDEFAALSKRENPYADPPAALRRILVETEVYRRLSESYLRSRGRLPDLTIIYLQGTDTDRPRLRAVRAAETAAGFADRLRPLQRRSGTILPRDRRASRPLCRDRRTEGRNVDDRFRSWILLARRAADADLEHGHGNRRKVASQGRDLHSPRTGNHRGAGASTARQRASGVFDPSRAHRHAVAHRGTGAAARCAARRRAICVRPALRPRGVSAATSERSRRIRGDREAEGARLHRLERGHALRRRATTRRPPARSTMRD